MPTNLSTASNSAMIRLPSVVNHVGLCKATIYKLISEGNFPRPKQLSKRAVAWHSEDIKDWINSRPEAAQLNSHK